MLSGSSPFGGPCRPWPSRAWKKLCLLIRCLPRQPLSSVKASGVSDARRSSEEGAASGATWLLETSMGVDASNPLPWWLGSVGDWILPGEVGQEIGGLSEAVTESVGEGAWGSWSGANSGSSPAPTKGIGS